MTWTQEKEPVVVETAVLRELSHVAVVVLLKQLSAQGAHRAVAKAAEAEHSDLTLVGQQGTAVAVVLAAEVLVEVAAAAVVVTVVVAAVATAAKAEELSVKFVEPFDGKMTKKSQKLNKTTLILGSNNLQFIHRIFK